MDEDLKALAGGLKGGVVDENVFQEKADTPLH